MSWHILWLTQRAGSKLYNQLGQSGETSNILYTGITLRHKKMTLRRRKFYLILLLSIHS
ncbi:hypothetical protein HanXRQr2_Chr12g0526781 [Helianthus annuus]|uniref:Uncharacterized protein n=1 Tax=Helianthus annuus TaxID=4232 RepID=A0A9K3HDA0_HELAN|nr:hypothetical protein HanXRQr2_Chr12g0526781 [Helianthus annuus]